MALIDEKGEFFTKLAGEKLDFGIDYTDFLGTDTIATSSWSVGTGITQSTPAPSNTSTAVTIWLSGGTADTEYAVTNTMVSAGGRTAVRTIRIKVVPPAVSSTSLITIDYLKSVMGRAIELPNDDSENGLLDAVVESASAEIKRIAGRNFIAADYVERFYPQDQDGLLLREFPLVYIHGIYESLSDGIKLTNTAANKISAQAWVRSNTLNLRVVGGASAGTNTFDLTNASYDTLSELITGINLISGWNATLASGRTGYEPSVNLVEYSPLAIGSSGASLRILGDLVDTEYDVDYDSGIIRGKFPNVYFPYQPIECLWVKYNAGFATIPDDLKLLAARYALYLYYTSAIDPTMTGERIGDYSYTRMGTTGDQVGALMSQIMRWKRQLL
jgi:hypothetical protein